MPPKKKGFNLEEHNKLGEELQEMHSRLIAIGFDLSRTYSLNSKIVSLHKEVTQSLAETRQKLDLVALKEYGPRGTNAYIRIDTFN